MFKLENCLKLQLLSKGVFYLFYFFCLVGWLDYAKTYPRLTKDMTIDLAFGSGTETETKTERMKEEPPEIKGQIKQQEGPTPFCHASKLKAQATQLAKFFNIYFMHHNSQG